MMKQITILEKQPKQRIQGITIMVFVILLMSYALAALTFTSAEDRDDEPTDRDTERDHPSDRPTDHCVSTDQDDRDGETDRERPDRERIKAHIMRLKKAAANGDEDAALKLRHLLARLDAMKDDKRERPEREERPNQERIDACIARLRRAAANGDEDAALKLRHLLARLDAMKDDKRERPEREERPNQERIDACIARLRRAAANGDEDAALKLRHLLARLD